MTVEGVLKIRFMAYHAADLCHTLHSTSPKKLSSNLKAYSPASLHTKTFWRLGIKSERILLWELFAHTSNGTFDHPCTTEQQGLERSPKHRSSCIPLDRQLANQPHRLGTISREAFEQQKSEHDCPHQHYSRPSGCFSRNCGSLCLDG